ncbi:hypothetical protein FisN_15Lh025 [Fistulifera solaris]|uniref:Myosin motor domain-containing protein n=1 Tax=Fistulifera solaris TaxID=1519565 RepID=A0A1Z5KHG3_FISSO|nr:hypothetical protein FisN_15Lh025 [Fistulifera solaris]|eukprot:GAX25657.1 hypothetical protein FisN_15Lh025 [Fistulifera solaris]
MKGYPCQEHQLCEKDASNEKAASTNVFTLLKPKKWSKARVITETESEATVQIFDKSNNGVSIQTISLKDYPHQRLPLQNVNVYDDLIDLPFLHEPGVLWNLRSRHANCHPYTRSGPNVLIAVNPYQWLSQLYPPKQQERYRHLTNERLPPHVYETAQQAYHGLSQQNQSILVSGESGAGKTETVKLCMRFLSQYGDSKITDRLLYANPVLEAFGNAATKRNDNSSRFGKYLTLQFDANCQLVGGRCDIYLLEKSLVVGAALGERNFHILHQIAVAGTLTNVTSPCAEFKCKPR